MKHSFILIIFILFSCKGQELKNRYSDIAIKIQDKELTISKDYSYLIAEPELRSFRYSITNNSDRNYAVVLDSSNFYIYSNTEWLHRWHKINNDDSDRQLFKLGIHIGNNQKFKNTGYNIISMYFENLPRLDQTINRNIIILKPKETVFRKVDFTYPIIFNKTNNKGLAQFFLLDDPEFFSIFLFQDKSLIIKHLNKENKKKMKELNAEIFTGLLESNRVPVKLK